MDLKDSSYEIQIIKDFDHSGAINYQSLRAMGASAFRCINMAEYPASESRPEATTSVRFLNKEDKLAFAADFLESSIKNTKVPDKLDPLLFPDQSWLKANRPALYKQLRSKCLYFMYRPKGELTESGFEQVSRELGNNKACMLVMSKGNEYGFFIIHGQELDPRGLLEMVGTSPDSHKTAPSFEREVQKCQELVSLGAKLVGADQSTFYFFPPSGVVDNVKRQQLLKAFTELSEELEVSFDFRDFFLDMSLKQKSIISVPRNPS